MSSNHRLPWDTGHTPQVPQQSCPCSTANQTALHGSVLLGIGPAAARVRSVLQHNGGEPGTALGSQCNHWRSDSPRDEAGAACGVHHHRRSRGCRNASALATVPSPAATAAAAVRNKLGDRQLAASTGAAAPCKCEPAYRQMSMACLLEAGQAAP